MRFEAFTTERLLVRALRPADAGAVFRYRSDPEVARFQGWVPESVDEVAETFARQDPERFLVEPGWFQLGIESLGTGDVVGDFGIGGIDRVPQLLEVGVALAPEHQGRGYALEGMTGLIDFLFSSGEVHRVAASIDPRNGPSIRLVEAVGFRKEGHLVRSCWFKGEWVDDLIYAVLKEDL